MRLGSTKRAAHFLLHKDLAGIPLTEAFVGALEGIGYSVDLYAPDWAAPSETGPGNNLRFRAEYGSRWLARNILSPGWLKYSLFSSTAEAPAFIAGALSALYRRPYILAADEIFSGSYSGNCGGRWKALCRWAMRRAVLTIVGDESRIRLQREYSGLAASAPITVYPGCYPEAPAPGDRDVLRRRLRIPAGAFTLAFSGVFHEHLGISWMIRAMERIGDLHLLIQSPNLSELIRQLMESSRFGDRVHIETPFPSQREPWSAVVAADAGMAIYHHSGPQFQNMGTSSNRLCMFLSMGLPVVASRQPSFRFLEEYDCGVLVESEDEFVGALERVRRRLPAMSRNAVECARRYIDAPGRFRSLVAALSGALA